MVRFLVRSDDARIRSVLEEFAQLVMKEYEDMMKSLKMKILRKAIRRIPDIMPCIVKEEKEGISVEMPIDVPEINAIREAVKKYTGRDLGTPKWKQNMSSKLAGYLTAKGVSFKSIEVLE